MIRPVRRSRSGWLWGTVATLAFATAIALIAVGAHVDIPDGCRDFGRQRAEHRAITLFQVAVGVSALAVAGCLLGAAFNRRLRRYFLAGLLPCFVVLAVAFVNWVGTGLECAFD
jgi:hypothetical protein